MKRKLFPLILAWYLISIHTLLGGGNNSYIPKYSNPFTEPWRWQSFSELTNKGCRCMIEDSNNCLWFGIDGGVLKYDGMNWNYYPLPKNFYGLPVVSLCFSSDGYLYVATAKGINRFKQGKWETIPLNVDLGDKLEHPYNKIPIIEIRDKSIWIGTHQGVVRIKNNKTILYRDNGYYSDPNKFGELRKQPLFDVYSIFFDQAGKLWLGLLDGRIFQCQFVSDDIYANPIWRRVDTEGGYSKTKYPLIKVSFRVMYLL